MIKNLVEAGSSSEAEYMLSMHEMCVCLCTSQNQNNKTIQKLKGGAEQSI